MMTARVRKKVRHSSNVTLYMDHLLGWPPNCRYPICRGGCVRRPLNRSMQHVINVGPAMGKTLEMVWRSSGDFLEISWRFPGDFLEMFRFADGVAWTGHLLHTWVR